MKQLIAFIGLGVIAVAQAQSDPSGYVLKPGEGESLGPTRLIKASPDSGTQGGVVVMDRLEPGFETTFHIHTVADEFFYVVSGTGAAEFDGRRIEIGSGDFIFVPAGSEHNLSVSDDGPMELLFVFDKPGADDWFREAHERFFSQSLPFSIDDCNEIGAKYDYVCLEQ
jgi:quercetin dioxygenase-like cupin family protein